MLRKRAFDEGHFRKKPAGTAEKRCPASAILVLVLLWCALSFPGCSTTINEEKAKDADDEGSLTELKADAEELKVVHSF